MEPVRNVQQAIDIGDNFVGRYHFFKKLLSCNRTDTDWVLLYDVGTLDSEFVKIRIDPNTGEVVEFTNHGNKKP